MMAPKSDSKKLGLTNLGRPSGQTKKPSPPGSSKLSPIQINISDSTRFGTSAGKEKGVKSDQPFPSLGAKSTPSSKISDKDSKDGSAESKSKSGKKNSGAGTVSASVAGDMGSDSDAGTSKMVSASVAGKVGLGSDDGTGREGSDGMAGKLGSGSGSGGMVQNANEKVSDNSQGATARSSHSTEATEGSGVAGGLNQKITPILHTGVETSGIGVIGTEVSSKEVIGTGKSLPLQESPLSEVVVVDSGGEDEVSEVPTRKQIKEERLDYDTLQGMVRADSLAKIAQAEAEAKLARARAAEQAANLEDSGLDSLMVATNKRMDMAKLGYCEVIDEETTPLLEDFFSYNSYKPVYVKFDPANLDRGKVESTLRQLKKEDGGVNKNKGKEDNGREAGRGEKKKDDSNKEKVGDGDGAGKRMNEDGEENDEGGANAHKKRRKRKPKISPKYIDLSESSFTDLSDQQPEFASGVFLHHFLNESRHKALILPLSSLRPQGSLVFSDDTSDPAKQARAEFMNSCRKTLDFCEKESAMQQILALLCSNPESFFNTVSLIRNLRKAGYSDNKTIASLIAFDDDLGKAVIVDSEDALQQDPAPQVSSMLTSILSKSDSSEDSRLVSSLKSSLSYSTSTPLCSPGSTRAFSFSVSSAPSSGSLLSPAPRPGSVGVGGILSLRGATAASPSPSPILRRRPRGAGLEFLGTNGGRPADVVVSDKGPNDVESYLAKFRIASSALSKIMNVPYARRLPVSEWVSRSSKGLLSVPEPVDYHPRYKGNPGFLAGSFQGEALPGVFRPCSSEFNETQALEAFVFEMGEPPETLVQLNGWVAAKFPPVIPDFDEDVHSVELDSFSLQFYGEIASLNLSKHGVRATNVPNVPKHQVRDHVSARNILLSKLPTLGPLSRYMPDPCLTTLGPTFLTRGVFDGYSIPHPRLEGHLVSRPGVLFDFNAISYRTASRTSLVGICQVCNGLLVCPDHVTYMCFFWPRGLLEEHLTSDIVSVWGKSELSVCWIHFVTDSVFIPGRNLHDLVNLVA